MDYTLPTMYGQAGPYAPMMPVLNTNPTVRTPTQPTGTPWFQQAPTIEANQNLPSFQPATVQQTTEDIAAQEAARQAAEAARIRQESINNFQTQAGNVRTSAGEQIGSSLGQQRGSILDYFTGAGRTLQGLNQRRTNAEMSRNAGMRDIMGMVGRGVKSGGVMLANKNAASSSAAGQMARAYGEMGNRENQKVQNQYGLEQQDINTQQTQFNEDVNTYSGRKLDEWKQTQAQSIADTVRNALADLDLAARNADLGTLFEIEKERQSIKDQAMQRFGELDNLVAQERSKLSPLDTAGARSQAVANEQLGQSTPQMFNFNAQAPVAQQQFGGANGNIPLYSFIQQKRRGV